MHDAEHNLLILVQPSVLTEIRIKDLLPVSLWHSTLTYVGASLGPFNFAQRCLKASSVLTFASTGLRLFDYLETFVGSNGDDLDDVGQVTFGALLRSYAGARLESTNEPSEARCTEPSF